MFKYLIKQFIKRFRSPSLLFIKSINRWLRKLLAFTHKCQFYCEWAIKPNPEWCDHFLDQYYSWYELRNPLGWERGIFNLLSMKEGAAVLELCCGDGFNAYHFYSIRAKHITSVDFDRAAIAHAKKNFKLKNVEYQIMDIRKDDFTGNYDNIIWDGAIEHFTLDEMSYILKKAHRQLNHGGVLSGYTIIGSEHGPSHDDHEYEFKSKQELKDLLKEHFKHVVVFDTKYPDRHNLYFFGSDTPLAFLNDLQYDQGYENDIAKKKAINF